MGLLGIFGLPAPKMPLHHKSIIVEAENIIELDSKILLTLDYLEPTQKLEAIVMQPPVHPTLMHRAAVYFSDER
jgi:hypothetical protein